MKPRKTPPTRGLVAVAMHGLFGFFIRVLRLAIRSNGAGPNPATTRSEGSAKPARRIPMWESRESPDLVWLTPHLAVWRDTKERYRSGERPTRSECHSSAAMCLDPQNSEPPRQCPAAQPSQLQASHGATESYDLATLLMQPMNPPTNPPQLQETLEAGPMCEGVDGASYFLPNVKADTHLPESAG